MGSAPADEGAGEPALAGGAITPTIKLCVNCHQHLAVACDECRRALALLDRQFGFESIARHPEQGSDCRLCERGTASLCVDCLVAAVVEMRLTDAYAPVPTDTP